MVHDVTPATAARTDRATAGPLFAQSKPYAVKANPVPDRSTMVLVADPVGMIAEVLAPVLVQYIGCRVVHARTVAQVREAIDGGVPGDLALVSLGLHEQAPVVIQVLRDSGWPRVLALTTSGLAVASAISAVDAGVDGVLRMPWIDPGPLHPVSSLSDREFEIVGLVADGFSNKSIAEQLSLSALTVKNHLARIGRKLDARDRAHIVAIAYRGGALSRTAP
ncbi:LuxR C-terminal-related transcriptional regulator [Nakamurella sp. GG22]